MVKYVVKNVNPKGRKTGDCSTRAVANLLNISWEEALTLQCEEACKCFYGITNKEVIERVVAKFGYVKMKQPRKPDKRKYLVGDIDKIVSEETLDKGVLILMANHWSVVKGNQLQDIWDCRGKTIGNYFIKVGK